MKVIEFRHPYSKNIIPDEDVVLVLGFFDGVHKGHQKVIETGRKIADKKGLKLAVMTFNQHPSIVFQKVKPEEMKYLTNPEQKKLLMAGLGVDYLYIVEFTSLFASLSPQDFVDQYIVDLHAKYAVAGFDYTYGPENIADMDHLPQYAQGRFEVVSVLKKTQDNSKVSSTRIRESLDQGNMELAASLLGYIYEIDGTVVHGDARGRTLGFPTANIKTEITSRLPKEGVYASEIKIGKKWYPAMGSIGHNDTFEKGRQLTIEVYILDFTQDIYGEQVSVRWNHLLRDQVAFNGAEELIQQLKCDEEDTRRYFAAMKKINE
ncbi:riboflavin biosynthesis protein RibF [Tetragenococcus halophilus]|uniref:riboflavin biosynthesis protein RibF n=1 Tax=Tetragenococcus halophilus TaxID=51669 RepID=UPI0019271910|nr:riboflavin biosynthesis protein RibF [Tetragenococcus halophilus]MCF1675785.1 riboflavin biosynthesis protein RibF [Tetragenococcus halophilus]MCO8293057.1 riboflavin biosynthesis protein RibF [Tetragenococcus halophilus]MDN6141424.1 riboflavin biosynthesis protein RibF [Tetragenococcus halophilus]MDN6142989.1 riboflavin biosynthesis protein RibF [Tetragenococcus halophilus]MDN6152821.1 riboflavin biosynthesis protein RibF [Tetragenococcus halophilus]